MQSDNPGDSVSPNGNCTMGNTLIPRSLRSRPLVSDSCTPYREVAFHNAIIPFPDYWPPYYNGRTNIPCDMLQGPCSCGASHSLCEWLIVDPAGVPK